MPVTRDDVVNALAAHEADTLRALLEASGVEPPPGESPRELAERVVARLWWSYATPLGYVSGRVTFDTIVDHVARKLRMDGAITGASPWQRLQALSRMLLKSAGPVALEDLDPKVRARLSPSWVPTAAYATGSTGSFGAWFAGKQFLKIGRTPLGRLLPLIPYVGPWYRALHRGAGFAAVFGGPAGFGLAVLAANNALGTNYHKLVPLLLGVGALGPAVQAEAEEVYH